MWYNILIGLRLGWYLDLNEINIKISSRIVILVDGDINLGQLANILALKLEILLLGVIMLIEPLDLIVIHIDLLSRPMLAGDDKVDID